MLTLKLKMMSGISIHLYQIIITQMVFSNKREKKSSFSLYFNSILSRYINFMKLNINLYIYR